MVTHLRHLAIDGDHPCCGTPAGPDDRFTDTPAVVTCEACQAHPAYRYARALVEAPEESRGLLQPPTGQDPRLPCDGQWIDVHPDDRPGGVAP